MANSLTSGWESFEVIQKDKNGMYAVLPFSDSLASTRKLAQVHNKIRMVQDVGWPEAKRTLRDDKGRPLIAKKDERIWLLKCKPSCWRLYFYVNNSGELKRIVYVYAVCKQKDEEDSQDAVKARRVADAILPGGSSIAPFEFAH